MNKKSLCIIPARVGSKAIPEKNIRQVSGKPLMGYVVEAVLASGAFEKVIISTESEKIAELIKQLYPEIEIPFIRPKELADDNTSLISVIRHAVDFYDKKGEDFEIIFSAQPTSPFTKPQTLIRAKDIMLSCDCDSVVTITQVHHFHPYRTYKYDENTLDILPFTEYTSEKFLQKQDRPKAYGMTGAVFGRRKSLIKSWEGEGFALGVKTKAVLVQEEEALDIDTPFDMEVFEALINFRMSKTKSKIEGYGRYDKLFK